MKREINGLSFRIIVLLLFTTVTTKGISQKLEFALHADPLITWMNSNSASYNSEGTVAGFSLGLDISYPLGKSFAVSSGLSILTAGGRQSATETHRMIFNNFPVDVAPGDEMKYTLRYLNIPIGMQAYTTRKEGLNFFGDLGFDIRILLRSKVDIPANEISGEVASNEVYAMNLGWHITGGIAYALGEKTTFLAGLGYDADIFDVTQDLENAQQPDDKSRLRMIRIRFGLKF
jgi:hypothetical protein